MKSNGSFDLKAYFRRISYTGDASPTIETLNKITEAHTKSISFENLDVVLNRGIQLASDAIFDKLVTRRRGGYCFEQNALLLQVLEHLGFEVTPISARVRLRFTSREEQAPRTHVFLRVEIQGETYLTDVGMGSASLTRALKLVPDMEQATAHETRRIVKENNRWYHQIRYGDIWQDACEFTLEEMLPIDREIANWFTSAHPQSHFKGQLIAARAIDQGQRISLQNLEFSRRERNGESQKQQLQTYQAFSGALTHDFGLSFSETELQSLFKLAEVFANRTL